MRGVWPRPAVDDVMAIDPGLGWLYVAAESGDLVVFDIGKPGLVTIDQELSGPNGSPVMRIMQPKPRHPPTQGAADAGSPK